MVPYSFVTNWHIKAPLEKVWEAIYLSEEWPTWWKGVKSVVEIEKGDDRGIGSIRVYKMQTALPYSLTFSILLSKREEYKSLGGNVFGDLDGTGVWLFEEKSNSTHVQCLWNVSTTIPWMNKLAALLKPVFAYNHSVVMRWGAKSLAKKLDAELLSCS